MAASQSASTVSGGLENVPFLPSDSGCTARGVATRKVFGRAGVYGSSGPAKHHGAGGFVLDEHGSLLTLAKADAALCAALDPEHRWALAKGRQGALQERSERCD